MEEARGKLGLNIGSQILKSIGLLRVLWGDASSNDCAIAGLFLQCSCEQRHLAPNEDGSDHGLLCKSESLECLSPTSH
ncbi:hypothetical protein TNCV_716931 [Trichonephila clavipes]|nr:hypothetical protein TNCV_716931 [Trichonephila clavipes]